MAWNIRMPPAEWITPESPRLESLINEVVATRNIAIDTETTGKDDMFRDHALYWSLSWGENRVCMPMQTLPFFGEAFRKTDKNWIFVNAKFDMHMLANLGIEFCGDITDTSVMHALLYEERPHSLEYMSKELLGWTWKDGGFKAQVDMQKVRDAEGKLAKNSQGRAFWESAGDALRRLEKTNLQQLVDYAANDAYGTFKIYEKLKQELMDAQTWSLWPALYGTMWDIFQQVEMPLTTVLWNCEREGILLNGERLQTLDGPMKNELADLEREMAHMASTEAPELFGDRIFNPRSTDHVRDFFFDDKGRGYGSRKMTKGGKSGVRLPSADKEIIAYFDEEKGDRFAHLLGDHRKLAKFYSDYVLSLPKKMDHRGRVHTHFNQDVARTGRLSSTNPNLQNIKRPDEDPYKIRAVFIAERGHELITADYEQLEMRLLACASMEPKMIDIFGKKWDIHMGNAAIVFGKKHGLSYDDIAAAKKIDKRVKEGQLPPSDLTDRVRLCLFLRQAAKSVGFGLNYGMKENKLARQIGVTTEEAIVLINEYKATYPAVDTFYDEAINRAHQTGFSYTIIGKRRFLPEIRSRNQMDAWQAERQAVNNEIQGTAANATAAAMIQIFREDLKKSHGCRMLLQVHDEIVFECPEENVLSAMSIIKEMMEHPFPQDLAVPLDVSIGHGPNWMDSK